MTTNPDKKRRGRSDKGKMRLNERDIYILTRIIEQYFLRVDHIQYLMSFWHYKETTKCDDNGRIIEPGEWVYYTDKAAMQLIYKYMRHGLVGYKNELTSEPGRVWALWGTRKKPGALLEFAYPLKERPPIAVKYEHEDLNTLVRFHLEERAVLSSDDKNYLPIRELRTDRMLKYLAGVNADEEDDRIPDIQIKLGSTSPTFHCAIQTELSSKKISRINDILTYFETMKMAPEYISYPSEDLANLSERPYQWDGTWYYVKDQTERFLKPKLEGRKRFALKNLREVKLSGPNGEELARSQKWD